MKLKNAMSKIESPLEGFTCKFEQAEERIIKTEMQLIEVMHSEKQNER
jgi:hypothetical protein